MLVIVRDLHLCDGSTGMQMPASAFEVFQERLRAMSFEASKLSDPSQPDRYAYTPIESFDLVLLGDIMDVIRNSAWSNEGRGQPGYARPWVNTNDAAFFEKVKQITGLILENNTNSCEILQNLAAGKTIKIPAAKNPSNPKTLKATFSRTRVPVKANIYYMVGNHDWFYHLKHPGLDSTRQAIVAAMGLQNHTDQFPYTANELPALEKTLKAHGVYARHGDHLDPFNHDAKTDRDHASLDDMLVIELFNKIPDAIADSAPGELSQAVLDDLHEIGSIRPDLMVPVWIAHTLEKHQVNDATRKKIDRAWHKLLGDFLAWSNTMDSPNPFEAIDLAQGLIKGMQILSLNNLETVAPYLIKIQALVDSIRGGSEVTYVKGAIQEANNNAAWARFIVYGHTHHFEMAPLRSAVLGKSNFDLIYMNLGTWHPLHERGWDDKPVGFVSYKTMSYLAFFKDKERKGRAYETWTGTLDL